MAVRIDTDIENTIKLVDNSACFQMDFTNCVKISERFITVSPAWKTTRVTKIIKRPKFALIVDKILFKPMLAIARFTIKYITKSEK